MIALILIISFVFAFRLIRWLAIVQQKECRLDRLIQFIRSTEGTIELLKLVPLARELTPTGLKRPQLTPRIISVAILTIYLTIPALFITLTLLNIPLIIILLLIHLLTPLIVILSTFPTTIIYHLITQNLLNQAAAKVKASNPTIIAITGSYAKTSTRHLLAHVLSTKHSVFTPSQSHNQPYSIAQSIIKHYQSQKIIILEYAAYKIGEIKKLTFYFPPQIGIITGISSQHLGLFGSPKNLQKAKSELISALRPKAPLFCNGADAQCLSVCQNSKHNFSDYSKISLTQPSISHKGKLSFKWKNSQIPTQLIGQHYLPNIKATIALAQHFKLSKSQIIKALTSFRPTTNLITSSVTPSGALIINDSGTANPKGFEAAVNLARSINKQRQTLLFSGIVDLGYHSQSIHTKLAKLARPVFSKICYTGITGRKQFQSIFGSKIITSQKEIIKEIKASGPNTLILLEGFIPQHIHQLILKK